MNLLMPMMIVMSFTLMMLNHPLSMGLILIIQTIMTAMIIGYMIESFLFSYIIIIIMLSGALVLFIYMASVASNEKFQLSMKMNVSLMILMVLMCITSYHNDSVNFMMNINYMDKISLIKIFNTMTAQLTFLMIIYLLFTMIVVSNIAKVTEGPLRTKY